MAFGSQTSYLWCPLMELRLPQLPARTRSEPASLKGCRRNRSVKLSAQNAAIITNGCWRCKPFLMKTKLKAKAKTTDSSKLATPTGLASLKTSLFSSCVTNNPVYQFLLEVLEQNNEPSVTFRPVSCQANVSRFITRQWQCISCKQLEKPSFQTNTERCSNIWLMVYSVTISTNQTVQRISYNLLHI